MAGFQLPVNAIPPQLLAEMARAAFRPPALMSGGGGGMGSPPQSQGFNVGQGMAGMGQGLGALAGALGKGGPIDMAKEAQVTSGAGAFGLGPGGPPAAGGGWFDFLSNMKMPSFGGG